jgi:hypothetical protein
MWRKSQIRVTHHTSENLKRQCKGPKMGEWESRWSRYSCCLHLAVSWSENQTFGLPKYRREIQTRGYASGAQMRLRIWELLRILTGCSPLSWHHEGKMYNRTPSQNTTLRRHCPQPFVAIDLPKIHHHLFCCLLLNPPSKRSLGSLRK